jgi:hypothetical protein
VVGKGDGLKKALDSIVKVIVNPNWKIKSNEQEIAGVEEPGLHMVLKKLFKLDQNSETCDFSFGSCLIDALSEETVSESSHFRHILIVLISARKVARFEPWLLSIGRRLRKQFDFGPRKHKKSTQDT